MWNPWESQKKSFKLNNSGLSNILFRADFLCFEQKKSPSELQKQFQNGLISQFLYGLISCSYKGNEAIFFERRF